MGAWLPGQGGAGPARRAGDRPAVRRVSARAPLPFASPFSPSSPLARAASRASGPRDRDRSASA